MLMGRQLDADFGELLKKIAADSGVTIHTGVTVSAISGEERVTGVALADGREFPADLVVVSAGVRANVGLAKEMGLEIGRAVMVNERMETNLPGVYACGDCAEYKGVNYAIWPEAMEQGKTAGANAAGEATEYQAVPAALTFHGMNTELFAAGDCGKNLNLLYKTAEFRDMGRKQYRKYYFLNDRLCGVILLGDTSLMAKLTTALENHASYKEVMEG